jgi:hypothetical protein
MAKLQASGAGDGAPGPWLGECRFYCFSGRRAGGQLSTVVSLKNAQVRHSMAAVGLATAVCSRCGVQRARLTASEA